MSSAVRIYPPQVVQQPQVVQPQPQPQPQPVQIQSMNSDEAIQSAFNMIGDIRSMVKDLQAALADIHETVKAQQANIMALDSKIEQHKRDSQVHCFRPYGQPIEPYTARRQPPYQPRDRRPYQQWDQPQYEPRDRQPYQQWDQPQYEPRYEPRDQLLRIDEYDA